ncbi:MAG TPA: GNAT family N-acetyltransferase [Bacteroidia bacterium]|nr:GNAT family N-acetyltransferase [Bacteroidia bacterium]
MLRCCRTPPENKDFQKLVAELDAELRIRDGDQHSFFAQFNKTNDLNHAIVAYEDEEPVGCGAIKLYAPGTMEIKRMYVTLSMRGKGIASMILEELENWSRELNCVKCILETGEKQPEAIRLYTKNNYQIIPNYGQYADVETSVCFEKNLSE